MKKFHFIALAIATAGLVGMTGCAETRAEQGALIGAGSGALLGQAVGGDTKSTVIGAALGGIAGAAIGDYQDKQHPNRKYYRDQYGRVYYIDNQGRAVYVN
ncbi:MAG: YMGG-like glycine zipper-containing protein [Sulfurovum sp.]|nr:YMGG-like glycine zipper-containing protein [Sulfurovum sp.]